MYVCVQLTLSSIHVILYLLTVAISYAGGHKLADCSLEHEASEPNQILEKN